MNRVKAIMKGIIKCGIPFIKYNFFKSNIKRAKNCYLYPYRGTILIMHPTAQLTLNGNLELNVGRYKGSKAESYFILDENSRAFIGNTVKVSYSSTIHVNRNAVLDAKAFTTNVGINFQIMKELSIGEDCMFGRNVSVFDSDFHPTGISKDTMKIRTDRVIIGNHVWVGANAFIMPGTSIEDGSIVGSQSYIGGNIPRETTVTKKNDTPKISGTIWARSTSENDLSKAMTYYRTLEQAGTALNRQYFDEIVSLLSGVFIRVNFQEETHLVSDHIVDSLTLISIVSLLEDHFGISIPFSEISAPNFESVERMSDLIARIQRDRASVNTDKPKQMPEKTALCEFQMAPKFSSILEAVVYYASVTPDKLCISDGIMDYSYAQLVKLVQREAALLRELGCISGTNVVAEGFQSPYFLSLELALHAVGAVFVPLEQDCAAGKVLSIAERCSAKLIITRKAIGNSPIKNLTYSEIAELSNTRDVEDIVLPAKDAVSEILFSTGTTGKEKGIVLSHGSSVAVAENIYYGAKFRNDNVELIPSPLNHSHGLRSLYANMIAGGSVIAIENVVDVVKFFDVMDRYHVNSIDLVPSALSILMRLSKDKIAEYRDVLRFIEYGSAPMLDADREKILSLLPNTPMYNFYGSTEAGRATVYNFNTSNYKANCIGKPTHNSELMIVDEDRRIIKSSREVTGTLACKGAMTMMEYYHDPEETSKAMENAYVYSNDEAYFDEDGDIILLGRKGDVINIGGKKVSPEEIENAAKLMEGVLDCACISIKDPVAGNAPKLFVQMEENHPFEYVEIAEHLSKLLESFKVPKCIVEIDKIPRTYNGKVSRKELARLSE